MKYLLTMVLMTAAVSAQAFDLNSVNAAQVKGLDLDVKGLTASVESFDGSKRPYGDQDQGKVWLQFRQMESGWWTTSENDPFSDDRIEVNVRRSFGEDFDFDFAAGSDREMGTIRTGFGSRVELSSGRTEITAEKWMRDDYRLQGFVRMDNGRNIKISLDMKKDFNSDNYAITAPGLTLSINRFGMTGEVTNPQAYPKKVLAALSALAMGIFQAPAGGF